MTVDSIAKVRRAYFIQKRKFKATARETSQAIGLIPLASVGRLQRPWLARPRRRGIEAAKLKSPAPRLARRDSGSIGNLKGNSTPVPAWWAKCRGSALCLVPPSVHAAS